MAKKFITCEGNYAAAHVAYMFSEVAAIYPITPSSDMAEYVDTWSAHGKKNLFGTTVKVAEMQSEGGAAGAVHGSLQAGSLTSTYTASQGLLLMIPNMYKMAGELLPAVFHVSARSLAAQALSIFGDHSDVMSCRQAGFAMLATSSAQQIMDIAPIAHLAAIKTRIPFMHFFDGFRTSHEITKVELPDEAELYKLIDQKALQEFRDRALSSTAPVTRGTAQNPDIYFQAREAASHLYDPIADVVNDYMKEITRMTGRPYAPFSYFGDADAENVIVAMGSVTQTIKEVIEYLKEKEGKKVGLMIVHLYRPFSAKYFMQALPKTVKKITVLDRTKEPGANGDPLYLDVVELYAGINNAPQILAGRYGLSSKDTTPAQIISVYQNMERNEPKNKFVIGIVDDVKFTNLPLLPEISTVPKGTFEGKFWGLGADGTVGANKNSIKIIGDHTTKYVQGYFAYDSKKSGGITVSHLRFGDKLIRSTYLVKQPDFVACSMPNYLYKYDVLEGIKKGGSFLMNSTWSVEETINHLPENVKKSLAVNEINFYIINATDIASEIGLGGRTNTIMQAAFFKVSNVIPYELAVEQMKKAIYKTYGKKGDKIVQMNYAAVDKGGENIVKITVPGEWKNLEGKTEFTKTANNVPDFVKNIMNPINALKGDELPVSAFLGREDGTFPAGTTQYEKRGIAVTVPTWIASNCIQCNQCAYVCPHACIRPFLATEEEAKNAPAGTDFVKGIGQTKDYQFRIQVSTLDCTGCGSCADVCPSKEKSLVMVTLDDKLKGEEERWSYFHNTVGYKDTVLEKDKAIKNTQFARPLFEFSGACAGCGETPYIKLATQLYGDSMTISNATGCSSIYGGTAPATPYVANENGEGPAWANSLFEDNAEYGYGIAISNRKQRETIELIMKEAISTGVSAEIKAVFEEWIAVREKTGESKILAPKVIAALQNEKAEYAQKILAVKKYLTKQSIWIIGGDGWAYDIGYGGLDHVLASGEDINVLVLDTEVYSNTGGQSSKSSPTASVAKFAASGKRVRKKDLGAITMTYGYIYTAQIAMGANQGQTLKAMKEAEAYPGPSLIIAYSPCIAHGLRAGMDKVQDEEKRAVECGYWTLYRYNPLLEKEGKNPFVLDSRPPKYELFKDFLLGEVRYNTLKQSFPEVAEELYEAAQKDSEWRFNYFKKLSETNYSKE